jgi:hypothetical protein
MNITNQYRYFFIKKSLHNVMITFVCVKNCTFAQTFFGIKNNGHNTENSTNQSG